MKIRSFIPFLFISSIILTPLSFAGDKVGNGGDGCVAEFVSSKERMKNNTQLMSKLRLEFVRRAMEAQYDAFLEKLNDPKVVISCAQKKFLVDPVTGKQVEAINDGNLHIEVGRYWCKKNAGFQKDALVLHEYLGLAGIERSQDYSFTRAIFPAAITYYDKGQPITQAQLMSLAYHVEDVISLNAAYLERDLYVHLEANGVGQLLAQSIEIENDHYFFSDRGQAVQFTDWLRALSPRASDGAPFDSGSLILPILLELDTRNHRIRKFVIQGSLDINE